MASGSARSEHQCAVLQWLARFPLLGVEEVAAFAALDLWSTDALVRQLCKAGAIDWVAPESPELDAQRRLYYLTSDGVQALAPAIGLTPGELEANFPASRRDLLARVTRVETAVALNGFFAALVEGLRHEDGIELEDARSTHWRTRGGGTHAPREVEAFACLRSGSSRAPFLVVWDRAGAPPSHRRLLVAAWYRADDVDDAWWGSLPPIFVVCPSQREAGQWTSALEKSAQRRGRSLLAVYPATAEEVQCGGPLAACWRRPGGQRAEGLLDRLGWRPPTGEADQARPLVVHSVRVESRGVPGTPPLRHWAAQLVASPERLSTATALERCGALSLALSATQKSLLEWVGHHPFLSAEELATLLELHESAVESLFVALMESRLVNSIVRPLARESTPPHRYFLNNRGLLLLAARDGVPPRRYLRGGVLAAESSDPGGAYRLSGLLRHFEHTVGANSFAVALAREAAEQRKRGRDHRLDAWLSAAEGQEWFRCEGRTRHVWPDARFLYRANGLVYDLFLEWDRGLVRARDYWRKFEAYGLFFAGMEEEAIAHQRLLVVTATPEAEQRVGEVVRQAGELSPTLASVTYLTTAERVEWAGALGAVWRAFETADRVTWSSRSSTGPPPGSGVRKPVASDPLDGGNGT